VYLNVGFLSAFAATHDANGDAILPTSKLPLINKAALAVCDAADGVKDGIISEPQADSTWICRTSSGKGLTRS
jgi:feruloyl esterase